MRRIVCTLSHNNANVEMGFYSNSEYLIENMHEENLVGFMVMSWQLEVCKRSAEIEVKELQTKE